MDLPRRLMHPPLMAVGDSLFQGVTSLTISAATCAWSAPAQVARGLGLADAFKAPDPPEPMIVDMPNWLRGEVSVAKVLQDMRQSGGTWALRPRSPAGHDAFDCLAVPGATMAEVVRDTPAHAERRMRAMKLRFGSHASTNRDSVSDLVQAVATRYILNPMAVPEWDGLSQMDWVRLRRPSRLLVNVGSNNGLYRMCFEADADERVSLGDELDLLADALHALPPEVEHIYVNSLVLPRTVCNLMPIFPDEPDPDEAYVRFRPGPGGYFPLYENRMGVDYARLTGEQLRTLDDRVTEANALLRDRLTRGRAGRRVHMVDVTSLLADYDHRHRPLLEEDPAGGCRSVLLADGRRLTTEMFETTAEGKFARGGLFSLDGMHLSLPGYGLMARRILETVAAHEPGTRFTQPDLEEIAAADPVLAAPPRMWGPFLWSWRNIRRLRWQLRQGPDWFADLGKFLRPLAGSSAGNPEEKREPEALV